tara:strand:- start:413 stop:622 length:210 start_codon:yes stop_codon:yes gene_type:complete
MWVLLMMIITAKGEMAVYDQGIYKDMGECLEMKEAVNNTDFGDEPLVQLTCVRWERETKPPTDISGLHR